MRELFDLTDETAEEVQVKNLCDVIDLDASEYNIQAGEDSKLVTNFTEQSSDIFSKCPFCEIRIGITRLASHFDKCRGHQEKVEFNPRALNKYA